MIHLDGKGLLFDLDGTLVYSIESVDRAWTRWSREHGLDPTGILTEIHGRRAIDSLKLVAPHLNPEHEFTLLERYESEDTEGVKPIQGALKLLAALADMPWGIVTSGTTLVARARMAAAGIPEPPIIVFGEEVLEGKPAPDAYLLGAAKLGLSAHDCIVFEDAVSGVHSALAAGAKVIAIAADKAAFTDDDRISAVVRDLTTVAAQCHADSIRVAIG
jgi:sugar-phosphatase